MWISQGQPAPPYHGIADEGGAQAVGPLVRLKVVLAVQLPHLNALGVAAQVESESNN